MNKIKSNLITKAGTITDIIEINNKIPEWDFVFSKDYIKSFLTNKKHLIAVSSLGNVNCGFMVCYINNANGYVRRWISAVLPNFRRKGVLKKLHKFVEDWCIENRIYEIRADVSNLRIPMQIANLKLGYKISGFELENDVNNSKVYFSKKLKK